MLRWRRLDQGKLAGVERDMMLEGEYWHLRCDALVLVLSSNIANDGVQGFRKQVSVKFKSMLGR